MKGENSALIQFTGPANFFAGFEKKSVNFLSRGVNESGWRGVKSLLKSSSAFLTNKIHRFFADFLPKKFAGPVNWISAENSISVNKTSIF